MKTHLGSKTGSALVAVMAFTLLAGVVSAMMVRTMSARLRQSRDQLRNEKAFFLAEAGAEQAAWRLAAHPENWAATISGELGGGSFRAEIDLETDDEGSEIEGNIRINPAASTNNVFFAVLPDNSRISRQDLQDNEYHPDYVGPAVQVRIRPMGNANDLLVDGSPYALKVNHTYTFRGDLNIAITNTQRNASGKAMGQWWIELTSTNATVTSSEHTSASLRNLSFVIESEGTIDGVSRTVTIQGLRQASWAKYALWYTDEMVELWMVGGEYFDGPVYSRPQMRFHDYLVADHGQTRFYDRAWSSHHNIRLLNNNVEPIFDQGLTLDVPVDTMASIDFDELLDDTHADYRFEGPTDITLSNDTVYVTNPRRAWTNEPVALPENGMLYVQTVTTGPSATRTGDLTVRAPDGLQGRLTLVADRDILVDNHIRYANSPLDDPESDDALGLTAGRHTRVTTAAPNDLDIFAHIICRTGGFGVDSYDSSALGFRGFLNVHGGIVNHQRRPVGRVDGRGYAKNYTYDQRFSRNPPPLYPTLTDAFVWKEWSVR